MVTLRPSLSRATAEEGAANQKLQAFSGTHSHPPDVWAGVRRCGEEAQRGPRRPGTHYRPDAAAEPRGATSGVPAPVRGPLPPRRGVTCKNRAFTWDAEPCRGIPGCSPCGHVPGWCVGDEVEQAGPSKWLTRAIWGLGFLLRDPQEALSSHPQSNALGSLQRPLSSGQADIG